MTILLILLLFVLLAALASPFGADSRGLRDHPWEIGWERLDRDLR